MKKNLAAFRFHAAAWRGAGHAMRCMTLARALQKKNWNCLFVTEPESYEFVAALRDFPRIEPEEFHQSPPEHQLLVVDHYDYGYDYEHHFRPYNQIIMAIDDIANRKHDCDIILDQAYGRSISDYQSDVPDHCRILVGPAWALLRDEFIEHRAHSLERRKSLTGIQRILINFGGNDQKNMILEALHKLHEIGYHGHIDIVFGVIAPHRESVAGFASTMPNDIVFHTNPHMAALLDKADMAIGAPAVSAWERFCLGIPTLILQTADNQAFTYKALCEQGLALGGTLRSLNQEGLIKNFDPDLYARLVKECADQVDGQGAHKIAHIIQDTLINSRN